MATIDVSRVPTIGIRYRNVERYTIKFERAHLIAIAREFVPEKHRRRAIFNPSSSDLGNDEWDVVVEVVFDIPGEDTPDAD